MRYWKKCSFCWETIKKEAKKCKYCSEWLDKECKNNTWSATSLENTILIIACIFLGIAIIRPFWYGFYIFNRVVLFVLMIILFVKTYNHRKEDSLSGKKLLFYGISGILHNPIFAVYLTRPIRTVIDIVMIVTFIMLIKKNKGMI